MKKKLSILFLCAAVAGVGLGFKNGPKTETPRSEVGKSEIKPTEPTPLSFLSDEDLMKESS